MLAVKDGTINELFDSEEMSSKSSHEVIIHPNLISTSLGNRSEIKLLWNIFDNLIMKPYFIHNFSKISGGK